MGSPPLVALEGKPPNIESYDQMQANALGRRLGQADLQGKNLQNQQLATILRGNQSIVAAQHDPNWDPSDPDQVVKLFKQYNVPLDLQASGMKFITDMKQSMQNQTKESLAASADAHAQFDDQLQAVRDAPADSQQKAYQQAISNARDFVSRYPNGPAKAQAMQEISSSPAIYDENWVRSQHAQLRTQQFLTEDALKKSQASEAAGKGAQATAESNLFAAQLPGAQAESGIKQIQLNMMQGAKPGDFDTAIDQIAPPTGPNASLNARTKSMVNFALGRGDIEGAKKAVGDASAQLGSIEKETSPAMLQFKAKEAANSAAIQQAIKNGSAEDAGKMLAQHLVAPSEIAARSNPSFLVQANKAALKYDSTYDAEKADADFNVAKAPQNVDFFASANSLTNKGGTLDQLEDQYKKLPTDLGRQFPFLNTIQDYRSYQAGNPAMAGFKQTALAAADDYAKVVGGGTGSDASRAEFMQGFSHIHSAAGFQAAIDAARAGVGSQQDARIGSNPILKNMYGGGTAASRTTASPTKQPAGSAQYRYHYQGAKGEIFSNDGKTWYDTTGNLVK
jgi:hypothetical protein